MELGIPELVVILLVVLLLFGPSRLPQAGAGLGKAIRGFRDAMAGRDEDKDEKEAKDEGEDGTRPKSEVRAALPPGARPSGG